MLDPERLEGQPLDHWTQIVRGDARVLKPDGDLLLVHAQDVIPRDLWREARDALARLRPASNNRGMAAGGKGKRAPSAVLGYMDRSPRFPWCRLTTFTRKHEAEYRAALPLFVEVSRQYRRLEPTHWARQQRFIDRVRRPFAIPQTAFTSVSLNRGWRTLAHADTSNRRPGLEALVVLDGGDGGELIFPHFQLAVDVRPGGLLLADMHEVHANAPLLGPRLTIVCYTRGRMDQCGDRAEESWRAVDAT
jgi:hypothetical protein